MATIRYKPVDAGCFQSFVETETEKKVIDP